MENLWKFLCLFGRLSLNSLRNSVKESLTVRIDFVDSFVYSPAESPMELFVCVFPCAAYICFQTVFSVPVVQFTLQFSAVRCAQNSEPATDP